ncbi:peptide-methionine (S)-S-oxide reductase MsrA [Novosphingobium sp. Gsoil 351]|uniref:peptide-methionine (S)-S-oxide reductase MsrA n=1 Tax=Novosphingobium sp. Gsoil 351 TaxID=2675225 RepID=UPI0012B470EE|nr:peptide-methionine (S)-S-oxide reductase MsrA [Novosphingobium sp. Gsoil 351]QGN55152.1 peptide-methionine (S)-S-oxide reductase MsrA [Novosphingobium sp. Gsoil 351]
MMRLLAPLVAASLLATACTSPALAEGVVATPAAKVVANEKGLKTAIFAGGCFWGIEGVFSHIKGVTSAVSGYHGGAAATATYDQVSNGDTGHAEAVKVTYDPAIVRYDELLRVFFAVGADPTQLNRQGPDHGTQYRTALVPMSAEQNRVAAAYLAQLKTSGLWKKPLVARIERAQAFYPAEAYHQDFMSKNPNHGYIRMWDAPKVAGLKRLFPGEYKAAFTPG